LLTSPQLWSFAAFLAGLLAGCFLQPSERIAEGTSPKSGKDLSFRETGSEADPRVAAAVYCRQAKAGIVPGLVAGQWTLCEAAEAFRVLDEANPNFDINVFRARYTGNTDEERHCREVIDWLTNYYSAPGAERPSHDLLEITKGLESQLSELLRKRGCFSKTEWLQVDDQRHEPHVQ
jgi:hypothetical protein